MRGTKNVRIAAGVVTVDLFFAVLPLLVLVGGHVLDRDQHTNLLKTPDISLVSCVLYGLALSRIIQSGPKDVKNDEERSLVSVLLAMIGLPPTLGIVFSSLIIFASMNGQSGLFYIEAVQIVNFIGAVFCFALLGGYSVYRSGE